MGAACVPVRAYPGKPPFGGAGIGASHGALALSPRGPRRERVGAGAPVIKRRGGALTPPRCPRPRSSRPDWRGVICVEIAALHAVLLGSARAGIGGRKLQPYDASRQRALPEGQDRKQRRWELRPSLLGAICGLCGAPKLRPAYRFDPGQPMSVRGQSRRFDPMPAISGRPSSTDIIRPSRLVRFAPTADHRSGRVFTLEWKSNTPRKI
jgi:hypothetical protein